jgi:plastocyanin
MVTTSAPPATPLRATRLLCAGALAVLSLGQLVAYLVLTAGPNPGIASTALLPAAAAAAVLLLPKWPGAVAALAVVVTVVLTRTVELPFDLARPGDAGPFAFAVAQLAACGIAAASAVRLLLLPAGRWRAPVLPAVAGLAAGALTGAGLLALAPQDDLTGGLTDAELAALPTVTMVDYRFEPAQLRVAAGQPFAMDFTNDGARPHSFAVPSLGIDLIVPSGRTRTVVLRLAPGTYNYVCSVGDHEEEGMKGRVQVVGADGTVPARLPAPDAAGQHGDHTTHGAHGG